MKKWTAIFLAVVLAATALTGCGESGEETSGKGNKKDSLIIGTEAPVNSLDLQNQQDQINNVVLKNTHQTLLFFTNEQTYEPGLAKSWNYTDETKTRIRCQLREDVTFSDGTPMTAEDVKFTYEMALKSEAEKELNGLLEVLILNPYEIEIVLKEYHNDWMKSLASVCLSIQSKAAYESGMEEPYRIGTGPYQVTDWKEGGTCRLEKVEGYWGEDKGEVPEYYAPGVVSKLEFRPYVNGSARAVALKNGEIDVCINPPAHELNTLEDDSNITIYEETGTKLFYLGFQTQDESWKNQKLRQAVACAIDREAVLDAAVNGKGVNQTTILNPGLWSFYDDMDGFDYDLERAKQLMEEAGYPGGDEENILLTTSLAYASSNPYEQMAAVIQTNLKKIGIEVELIKMEDADLKTACEEGTQQMFLWRWNEDSKIDFVYRHLFYTDSINNYFHFSDPKVDQWIDQLDAEKNEAKRLELSKELQTYLVDSCAEVPLYSANLVIAYKKELKGLYLYRGGNHIWAHAYLE